MYKQVWPVEGWHTEAEKLDSHDQMCIRLQYREFQNKLQKEYILT